MNNSLSLKNLKFQVFNPISYYMRPFSKDFLMSRHYHPYIEIMYCRSGRFTFEALDVNQSKGAFTKHAVSAGEFIVIDAGVPHRLIVDGGEENVMYNIEFEIADRSEYNPRGVFDALCVNYREFIDRSGLSAVCSAKNGYVILTDVADVEHRMRSYINALTERTDTFEGEAELLTRQLVFLSEIGKCCVSGREGAVPYVKKAREYINKNFTSDLCIDDVAAYAGVNKFYLQRIYRKYTGSTIMKSVMALRVERAKQLLRDTNLPAGKIGTRTGFRNGQQFVYEFKALSGITPTDYRKKMQAQTVDRNVHDLNFLGEGVTVSD